MLFATSGTRFFIGASRPGWSARWLDDADLGDEAWTEVSGISALGRISGEWGTKSTSLISNTDPDDANWTQVDKTERPAKQMQVVAALITADTGQNAMLQAEDGIDPYAFRLILSNGEERRFVALVVSADHVMDEANSVLSWGFGLVLQSSIQRIA